MPTNAHDAQDYTANGPTTIGFRTGGDGRGIENGVVAIGNQIGVRGICVGGAQGADFCGVVGEGGVVGRGVRGQSKNQVGVIGISDIFTGVQGLGGPQGEGVNGFSSLGVGVKGLSTSNDGIVGSSSGDRKSGVFGDHTQPTGPGSGLSGRSLSPEGTGVFGFSDAGGIGVKGFSSTNDGVVGSSKVELKSGVFGENKEPIARAYGVTGSCDSPKGAGVRGISDEGYGGDFRGGLAPLRLVPAKTNGRPTQGNHQRGEFFVDSDGDLFFCKNAGTPGDWFRVQLTPA
jgi:hypothetical protein